jgi:galactokinase
MLGGIDSRPKLLRGKRPEGRWQSPGRVNLIGEFTDYNMGLVLPFAISRRLHVLAALLDDPELVVSSDQTNDVVVRNLNELSSSDSFSWASYVTGVVWAFQQYGVDVPGIEFAIHSEMPSGAGLSSSAAIEAAVAVAINDITASHLDASQLARLCHKAETEYVGVPCGIMDQFAVLNARSESAMLIDCLDFSIQQVPFSPHHLIVVDTRVRHTNRDGGYALKRSQCMQAASRLGIASLRDASLSMVEESLDGDLAKVAFHVVTENGRVIETVGRLSRGEPIGDLLLASHRSLQHYFGASCPELDCVVDTAMSSGAEGARMFGAGNGGCALVLAEDWQHIVFDVEREFQSRGFRSPQSFVVRPCDGAGRMQ